MADDLGYSDLGCYGGEIQTPNLDQLAENGLRFTHFYNCGRCWPSRTALITGCYPQQTNTDPLDKSASLPSFVRPLPAYLRPQGYRCYHSGKWHVKPAPEEVLKVGQFDRSYNALDYDRKFGSRNNQLDDRRLPPFSKSDFYIDTSITDYALEFLDEHRQQIPEQPFFLYLAYLAPHFPLQAPEEDIEKYRGKYSVGWDRIRAERYERITDMGLVRAPLPERETGFNNRWWGWSENKLKKEIGPGETIRNCHWEDLTSEEKAFQARKMEIHAASIDRMDQEIGRVVAWLKANGQSDNTLIMFASDNGASSEELIRGEGNDPNAVPGSAGSFLCLGPGWAWTANTPFRYRNCQKIYEKH
jgi:arylsulfatase